MNSEAVEPIKRIFGEPWKVPTVACLAMKVLSFCGCACLFFKGPVFWAPKTDTAQRKTLKNNGFRKWIWHCAIRSERMKCGSFSVNTDSGRTLKTSSKPPKPRTAYACLVHFFRFSKPTHVRIATGICGRYVHVGRYFLHALMCPVHRGTWSIT